MEARKERHLSERLQVAMIAAQQIHQTMPRLRSCFFGLCGSDDNFGAVIDESDRFGGDEDKAWPNK